MQKAFKSGHIKLNTNRTNISEVHDAPPNSRMNPAGRKGEGGRISIATMAFVGETQNCKHLPHYCWKCAAVPYSDRDRQRQDDRTDHVERVAKTVTQKIGQKLRDGMKATEFMAQIRLREPFGVARAARFERMAGVFAIRAAPPNTTAT